MKSICEMTIAELEQEAARRKQLQTRGLSFDTPTVQTAAGIETPGDAAMREKREDDHQLECRKLMRALGFFVVNFSQKRRSKVTPGIPDTKYYHEGRGLTFWHEDKAVWGRQSTSQKEFQRRAEACHEIYVLGTLEHLKVWLVENGVAVYEGELLVPTPYAQEQRTA